MRAWCSCPPGDRPPTSAATGTSRGCSASSPRPSPATPPSNAISLLTPSGALSGECREVIDACRSLDLSLATGHASLAESRAVAAYCADVGQRLLITHPLHYTQDPGELRQFAELGAFVEFASAPLLHPDSHLSVRDVHEAMSALGPDRIILAPSPSPDGPHQNRSAFACSPSNSLTSAGSQRSCAR